MQYMKYTIWTLLSLLNSSDRLVSGFTSSLNKGNTRWNNVIADRRVCSKSSSSRIGGVSTSEGDIATSHPATPTPPPPDMPAYATGYTTVFTELPFSTNAPSFGTIPPDLFGSYYRSGPAMFSAGSLPPPATSIVQPKQPPVPDGTDGDRMVRHPFDADGGVLGVTFSVDGSVTARFRYVRTLAFTNERKKGLRLYDGMGSTRLEGSGVGGGLGNDFPVPLFRHHLKPGLNKKRKNTSNTRSVYWGKRLLSLWEGGLPYKLDSLALSTEGKSQLGGILLETQPFSGVGRYDHTSNRMVFYSNVQDAGGSELTLYEFNDKFRLVNRIDTQLKTGVALLSDFGVTESYSLFVQPEVDVDGMAYFLSKDPGSSIKVGVGAGSYLHLISRDIDKTLTTVPMPNDGISDFDLQFCNSYEEPSEDGNQKPTIVFDVIRSDGTNAARANGKVKRWPWVDTLQDYQESSSRKSLWRYRYKIGERAVEKELISDLQTSFGVINPDYGGRKHRYIYANVGAMGSDVAPPQGIAKFDMEGRTTEVWFPKEYEFCGEPIYAPRSERVPMPENTDNDTDDNDEPQFTTKAIDDTEDGGYIISILLDGKAQQSHVLIFNANAIANGPIARVPLGMGLPHGLHGCFTADPQACWPSDEIERRTRLADKMESRGNRWNEVKSDFSGLGLRLDDFEEYFGDIL